jgi:hypothetical protein
VSEEAAAANPEAGDRASAETTVPPDADALFAFVSDIERLLRLNPHLEIEAWRATPDGFHLAALNEMNERRVDTAARIEVAREARRIVISYATGLKRATTIAVEPDPAGAGSRLVLVDHYPLIEDPQDPRLTEVDRSLIPWVAAIRRHLIHSARWGRLPGWRWWNERLLPGMPPRQRRIVRLIVWVSAIEFVLFLALVAVLVVAK